MEISKKSVFITSFGCDLFQGKHQSMIGFFLAAL